MPRDFALATLRAEGGEADEETDEEEELALVVNQGSNSLFLLDAARGEPIDLHPLATPASIAVRRFEVAAAR